jgi:hypothetical protein
MGLVNAESYRTINSTFHSIYYINSQKDTLGGYHYNTQTFYGPYDALMPFTQSGERSVPIGYYIPADDYTIVLNDFESTGKPITMAVKNPENNVYYNLQLSSPPHLANQTIHIKENATVIDILDCQSDTLNVVSLFPDIDAHMTRKINISGFLLSSGQDLHLMRTGAEMHLKNNGSATNYTLYAERCSEQTFSTLFKPLQIQENTVHHIIVDWNTGSDSLTAEIWVDQAMDGNMDDNILINKDSSNTSTLITETQLPDPSVSDEARFGRSVDIHGDYAIAGAFHDTDGQNRSGSAIIYKRIHDNQWQQQTKLVPPDGQIWDTFGAAVALADEYAFIGAPLHDAAGSGNGAVYIYKINNDSWTLQQKLLPNAGEYTSINFGQALDWHNGVLAVAAPDDFVNGKRAGKVHLYQPTDQAWYKHSSIAMPSALAHDGDEFGCAVDIHYSALAVGAKNDDATGAVYVFNLEQDAEGYQRWNLKQKLNTPTNITANDEFGAAVALTSEFLWVGAPGHDGYGDNAGAAWVYQLQPGHEGATEWTKTSDIMPNDIQTNNHFGATLAVENNMAIAGAYLQGETNPLFGSAWLFRYHNAAWTEIQKLDNAHHQPTDGFGCAVASSLPFIIVGADGYDKLDGTVFIYKLIENNFGALRITTQSLAPGQINVPYSCQLQAEGGQTPLQWLNENNNLPQGLTLDENTGLITGTPTEAGTKYLDIKVIDSQSSPQIAWKQLSITIQAAPPQLKLKCLLQGAYQPETQTMNTNLAAYLPIDSPYLQAPKQIDPIPQNSVDWVLVELKKNPLQEPDFVQSYLVKNDGQIMDIDENGQTTSLLTLHGMEQGTWYVTIKHRNHIYGTTRSAYNFNSGEITTVDLTRGEAPFASNRCAMQSEGRWILYGGDVDQDGQVTSTDYVRWYNAQHDESAGYKNADIDMDGIVDTQDYMIIMENAGKGARAAD